MPWRTAVFIVALLLTLVSCDQSAPSSEPSTTASPAVRELATSPDPLPAGTYTRTGFEPPITFQLDGSWSGVQLLDGFFDVQQNAGTAEVVAVQFGLPRAVYGAEDTTVDATTAQGAAAALAGNPTLEILGQNPAQVGGLEGTTIEVENAREVHAGVLVVQPGPLGIDPGRRLWIAFLDAPDGLLAIMVGGTVARWDDALSAAEPVLESVRIGP